MADRRRRTLEFSLYLAGPLVAIATTPILARALGPDERGQLGVALAIVSIAATIGALGLPQILLGDARSGKLGTPALAITGISSLLSALVAFPVAVSMGLSASLGVLASVGTLASVLAAVAVSAAVWNQRTFAVSISNAFAAGLRLVLIPALALFTLLTVDSAFAITLGVPLLASLILLSRDLSALPVDSNGRSYASSILTSLPVVSFGLLTAVTLRADLLILQAESSAIEVGTYAAVVAVTQAALAVSSFFRNRVQATVSRDPRSSGGKQVYLVLGGLAAAGVIGAQLLADPLCAVLFGPEFVGAPHVLRALSFAAAAQMFLDVGQSVLIARGQRRALLIVGFVGAAVTITSLLLLVAPLGALGAAIGTFMGAAAAALVAFAIVLYLSPPKPESEPPR